MSRASQAVLNRRTTLACRAASGLASARAATMRRRAEDALPLETARARAVYGQSSAVNRLLVLNAEPRPGRATVLLLREAIGF
ncbi:hypothetical protein [Streptomyces viridochromogenes]|nr:hypothetical protein [Streptomyces viridochromogenes]